MTADVPRGQPTLGERLDEAGRAPGRAAPAGLSVGGAACGRAARRAARWPPCSGRGSSGSNAARRPRRTRSAVRRAGGPRPGRLRAPTARPRRRPGRGRRRRGPAVAGDVRGAAARRRRPGGRRAPGRMTTARLTPWPARTAADAVTVGQTSTSGPAATARARRGASRCWPTRPRTSWPLLASMERLVPRRRRRGRVEEERAGPGGGAGRPRRGRDPGRGTGGWPRRAAGAGTGTPAPAAASRRDTPGRGGRPPDGGPGGPGPTRPRGRPRWTSRRLRRDLIDDLMRRLRTDSSGEADMAPRCARDARRPPCRSATSWPRRLIVNTSTEDGPSR